MNALCRTVVGLGVAIACLPGAGADHDWKLQVDRVNCGSLAISPDGNIAAVGCRDSSIRLWDVHTGRELRRLIGHRAGSVPVWLSFSPDGRRLVSTTNSFGLELRLWSVASGENLFTYPTQQGTSDMRRGVQGAVAFHPKENYFAAVTNSPGNGRLSLCYWDAESFKMTVQSPILSGLYRINFSPDGRQLIAGVPGTWLHLGNVSGNKWTPLPETGGGVFSPDGKYMALITSQAVVLRDRVTLSEVRRFKAPDVEWPTFRTLQFTPDGRRLCAAAYEGFFEWELETGKFLRSLGKGVGQMGFAIDHNGRILLDAGPLALIVWDFERGQRIARLTALAEEDQWLVETAAGYFDHPDGLRPRLKSYDSRRNAEAYFQQYHQPQIVARLLAGMTPESAVRLPRDSRSPEVALELIRTTDETAELLVSAQAFGKEAAIQRVAVAVNGRELDSIRTKSIVRERLQADSAGWRTEVTFPPGENFATVRAVAYDNFDQQSQPAALLIERPVKVPPVPGRLFVLAVGVSSYRKPQYDLRFCHADAQALADTLAEQKGRAFGDVQVQVYTDKQATVTNVEEGLAWLQRSCTPADVAVVLFSGHGIRGERGLYYMTHEANIEGIQYSCLNWETVAQTMKKTQAKQLLFLSDVCYAGSFAESQLAPQQELAESLRKQTGIMVFASSRGIEKSLEDSEWQHGAFCKAILEALAGQADTNGDGKITLTELHEYATRRVVELTGDRQHPHLPNLGDFDPQLVLAHEVSPAAGSSRP